MKKQSLIRKLIFLLWFSALPVWGQETGAWAVGISGNYSLPLSGLAEWFQPTSNFAISIGQQHRERWFIDGMLEFARFSQENLQGYPAGRLELELEHLGLLVNGQYRFVESGWWQPFLYLGAGIFQTESLRGEIQADSTVTPFVPFIPAKKRSETNWGFRGGAGVSICLTPRLRADFTGFYRLIIGDLWPTLQPGIELEGVSGFQTANCMFSVRYFF